jgi:N-carbamoylputrescine amidase
MPAETLEALAIQFTPVHGDVPANLQHIDRIISAIDPAEAHHRLIVLPEMCSTGYIFSSQEAIKPLTENRDGPTFHFFSGLARKQNAWLVYGFAEQHEGLLYNTQNIIDPQGSLKATYRKVHLFDADLPWATPGSAFMNIETPFGRIGPGICMDLNFDDFIDYHIDAGTDIICFSANWLDEGHDIGPYWKMRIYPFPGLFIAADRSGKESGTEFIGSSMLLLNGEILSRCGKELTAVQRCILSITRR